MVEEGELIEFKARQLLRRYGVVFHKLLVREAHTPPWRELLRVYRRLEARGEIRGGRFITGFSGEQYALPEAVGQLRAMRRRKMRGSLVTVNGADPLNLVGIVTPGTRVPSLSGNRILVQGRRAGGGEGWRATLPIWARWTRIRCRRCMQRFGMTRCALAPAGRDQ